MPGVFADQLSSLASSLIDRARVGVVQVRAEPGHREGGRPGRRSEHRPGRDQARGAGSGIVWGERQIITNHHVVAGLQSSGHESVGIVTSHDARLEARVVRTDPRLDLAMLEVNDALTPMPVGDSSVLRVGEIVFALGHPWGQPWVATAGVVSGLGETHLPGPRNRSGRGRELIRTDAQLRPGNSGGALLNARGEAIGVNAMVWSGDLGVAIPSRVVKRWLESAPSVRLGVQLQVVALRRGFERSRALMVAGLEDGPARRAGVSIGDVLLELNGRTISDGDELLEGLANVRPGAALELGVLRAGQLRTISVSTEEYARAA